MSAEIASSRLETAAIFIPSGIFAMLGARSLQFLSGTMKIVAPAFLAAKIFSATPPILPTRPVSSIVPVVATIRPFKIFSGVSSSTIPSAKASPPLGPPVLASEISISLGAIFEVPSCG